MTGARGVRGGEKTIVRASVIHSESTITVSSVDVAGGAQTLRTCPASSLASVTRCSRTNPASSRTAASSDASQAHDNLDSRHFRR